MSHAIRPYKDKTPRIGDQTYVDPAAVVIGDVSLAEEVSVWPMVVIRGDVNRVAIGRRSNIQDGSIIHTSRPTPANPGGYPVIIGDDVTIGHKAVIHACTIGDQVLIGMGAIVLDGAVIEDQVIVGAGALVTPGKRLVSGYLYTGSPARQARPLSDGEKAHFTVSADNYVRLKNDYLNPDPNNKPAIPG